MTKTVQVYDFHTKKVTSIPASELAPGMVEAEVTGVGRVWIAASQIKDDGPYRHPPFTETTRQYLRQIKSSLDEVRPMTLEEWEDGFRRDVHAEREIAIWLHIASTYRRCTEDRAMSPEQRRDYFKVVVACSVSSRERVFEIIQLSAISREQALQAVEFFYPPQK